MPPSPSDHQPLTPPLPEAGDASLLAELASLRQTEARIRSLVERAAFGIFRCDPEGRIVDANEAFAAMLGFHGSKALHGVSLVRAVLASDGERRRWYAAVATGELADWLDLQCRRGDGGGVRLRIAVTTERDAAGRTMGVQGIAENVTERVRREEIVRRGERMASLGRTLAGVAHEINNPLAAIIGFAQILLKGERSPDDRHVLVTVLNEARRASRIVKDLLTIARREELVERQRVDLNAIIRYIIDTQRYAMETRGITTTVELADDLPAISADTAQMEQVVLNLVVNARQALESVIDTPLRFGEGWRPELCVRTSMRDDMVELEVSDNGPGIDDGALQHIWDPFWTTKEEGEGTGLGLSVVHGIVTAHGGRIDVSSAPGEKTRFTVSIAPVADLTPPPVAAPRAEVMTGSGEHPLPLDVLVIDDEAPICDILSRILSARGHAVLTATGGAEALRLAESAGFDVVITDLRMPGMDGREVIRRLRLLPAFTATRFLLSTGDFAATGALSADGTTQEEIHLVEKPYEVDALVRLVEGRLPDPSYG